MNPPADWGRLSASERAAVRASLKDAIKCATSAHEAHNSEHTFATCEAIRTAYGAIQIASGVLSDVRNSENIKQVKDT